MDFDFASKSGKKKTRTLAKDFFENVKKWPRMSIFPKAAVEYTPLPIDTQTIK